MWRTYLHKIGVFFALCVALLAAIGGTVYLFVDCHAVFGVANLVLVALAWPKAEDLVEELL